MNEATRYGIVGYLQPGNMLYWVLTAQSCHGSSTEGMDRWGGPAMAVRTRKLKINMW